MNQHIESSLDCVIYGDKFCSKYGLENHIKDKHGATGNEVESDYLSSLSAIGSESCILTFATLDKLSKHMCKITVKNPSFSDLYTKNWIPLKSCNLISHKMEKN